MSYSFPPPQGSGAAASAAYARPSDWLAKAAPAAESVSFLVHVGADATYNNTETVRFSFSGTATVVWGDGNSEALTSGVETDHTYAFADLDASTLTEDGIFRQCNCTITVTGGTITSWWSYRSSADGQKGTAFREVILNTPSLTSIVSSTPDSYRGIERVEFIATMDSITTLAAAFASWYSLREVVLPAMASLTSFSTTVNSCYRLQKFTSGLSPLVTNLYNMFGGCRSLTEVDFGGEAFSAVTTASNTFNGCELLTTWPDGVTFSALLTNMTSTLLNSGITEVPETVVMSGVTNMTTMAQDSALQVFGPTDLSSCTTATAAFYRSQIQAIPAMDLSSCTTFGNFARNLRGGRADVLAAALDCSAATSLGSVFAANNLRGITSFGWVGMKVSFTLDLDLDAAALEAVCDNLATVVGQTFTCSGCPGYATADFSVATGKGWTIA